MRYLRSHFPSALISGLVLFVVTGLANAAPPLPGAIFTTDANGSVVNGNTIYAAKCDVYLDGGPPPQAPQEAAGLDDGNYFFQVTDPSGKRLLSSDPVENREIIVSNGIITGHTGTHGTNPDQDQGGAGAIVVQLCPYDDTPNNGGVYKAWVTPIGDFLGDPSLVDNPCNGGCFHGFLPPASKTDNFKVGDKEPTFCLEVTKDAVRKSGNVGVANWEITVTDPLGVQNVHYTGADGFLEICGLTAGEYNVTEALTDSGGAQYDVIFTSLNGDEIAPPTESVDVTWRRGHADTQTVQFINTFVCDKNCK